MSTLSWVFLYECYTTASMPYPGKGQDNSHTFIHILFQYERAFESYLSNALQRRKLSIDIVSHQ